MKPHFDELNAEKFEISLKAILVMKKEKDLSLKSRFAKMAQEVTTHRYDFGRLQTEAEILEGWLALEDKSVLIENLKAIFY